MWNEILPLIMGGGGLLAGAAALFKVFIDSKSTKETIKIDHSQIVLEGYNELVQAVQDQVDKLQTRVNDKDERMEVMSITIERLNNEIRELRVELRDRDDQIRMLTLDRDDLVSLVTGTRPNLRTI